MKFCNYESGDFLEREVPLVIDLLWLQSIKPMCSEHDMDGAACMVHYSLSRGNEGHFIGWDLLTPLHA